MLLLTKLLPSALMIQRRKLVYSVQTRCRSAVLEKAWTLCFLPNINTPALNPHGLYSLLTAGENTQLYQISAAPCWKIHIQTQRVLWQQNCNEPGISANDY